MAKSRWTAAMAVLFGSFVLAGCAGVPAVPYDRSSAADIKTIGLAAPGFPDDTTVGLASSPGASFGLIGALVEGGIQSARESRFKSATQAQKFSAREEFVASLVAALKKQGYAVAMIPSQRKGNADFLEQYPSAESSQVDAYLDVVVMQHGYLAAGVGKSNPYRPFLSMKTKLVRASDKDVLMQDMIVYNPVVPVGKSITIAPDPAYQFVDSDALVAAPAQAVLGMKVAINQSTLTLGSLLK